MLLEGDPFSLIEGMTIAGFAAGATQGYVYLRVEYPHAARVFEEALRVARERGYLGLDILGSGKRFDITSRVGAGAYICGEETSMLESLQGRRGEVRVRPPLPAIKGLFDQPTVVNNVVTLATVPVILARGPAFYRDFGMGKSRGTVLLQLAGNVKNGGLVERAFGLTVRELVFRYGGGSATGKPVRAVQIGGPLGAYLAAADFDTPLDYEALSAKDALLGHGGVVVFDESVDMARMARHAFAFCAIESCGKCTPCRIGSTRGVELIDRLRSQPNGSRETDLALIEELCETMAEGSLCGLGGMTPFPGAQRAPAFPRGFLVHALRSPRPRHAGFRGRARHARKSMASPVTVPAGTSVMRAAALASRDIPKLCATDTLKAFGSCRVCLVHIEGRKGTPASCTTEVAPGMKVHTESEVLQRLRKNVLELYVSEHPIGTCADAAQCEVESLALKHGVRESRYAHAESTRARHAQATDASNPYFRFDDQACIVCSRCVRACEEQQGTFALSIAGRGLQSRVSASQQQPFFESECVSCGACVEVCPTGALLEKSLVAADRLPQRSVKTTCAYCGVGCTLIAEVRDDAVSRMVPDRAGRANQGHACVKGRFAYGYATHPDRVTRPLIRKRITDDWREVSWDEALAYAASEFRRIQAAHGRDSIGGITSSRCTNEETFLVQKLVRAAFGTNNVDTCARVCHSPTGYGLKHTLGESAGTQEFVSVQKADVIMVIGASPTEAHPVFASQMKRRLRAGAKLIVVDPRAIGSVKSPHVRADHHLRLLPGTNVAVINALAHVVVTEGLTKDDYIADRCERDSFEKWKAFVADAKNSPEAMEAVTGVPAASCAPPLVCTRAGPIAPSTTDWASPSTARARPWSWASRISPWPRAIWAAKAWA